MSKVRYTFSGTLVAVSPLHLGSGDFRHVATVTGKGGDNKRPEVAAILRDALGRPYIPATSLKGLLRRLMEEIQHDDHTSLDHLLGVIKNSSGEENAANEKQGMMGALHMRGAECIGTPPDVSAAPYADQNPNADQNPTPVDGAESLGPGVFIAARTRIDPSSGTSQDSTLFFQEMVAAGTTFRFRCLIEPRSEPEAAEALVIDFLRALDRLTHEDGQAMGRGQADGLGRLRLRPDSLGITRQTLAATGRYESSDATDLWRNRPTTAGEPPAAKVVRLALVCDGPFVIIDGSHEESREENDPQLKAQRLTAGLPLVLGSSLSGALRARARWLAALKRYREGAQKDASERAITSDKDAGSLTAEQRLFGVAGFRGLLGIERIEVKEAVPWDITSVKIDRFSGAPVDNALFTTNTFVGVRITVSLRLGARSKMAPDEKDEKLFAYLIEDIQSNGLQLGHGGNKGFGWFKVCSDSGGARDGSRS